MLPNDLRPSGRGCGGRGGYLLGEALAAGGVEVVALADVWRPAREQMAARVKEKTGREPRLFPRHKDALALAEVDAVVIATPDFSHPMVLADAVRAGKDAFVEKPLSARLEDAVMATDAVKASGRVVQVGTQRRSDTRFRVGAERIRAGALGPLRQSRAPGTATWRAGPARPTTCARRTSIGSST